VVRRTEEETPEAATPQRLLATVARADRPAIARRAALRATVEEDRTVLQATVEVAAAARQAVVVAIRAEEAVEVIPAAVAEATQAVDVDRPGFNS
jgi:hypothetical protein